MRGLSGAGLREDIRGLAIPVRSRALLEGQGPGLGVVEALTVRLLAGGTRSLADLLMRGEERPECYRGPVSSLRGLGPGQTPSGDDLLVGLAAMASRLARAGLLRREAVAAYRSVLVGLPPHTTTPVAHEMVRRAARGQLPPVLRDLVEALGSSERPATLRARSRRLAATGAQSGADMLAGVLAVARAATDGEARA